MQVTLEAIHHSYGSTEVFRNLDLRIQSGELLSLLGPSGCGKTTLLRMLAGFIEPDSGKVFFADEDVTRLAVHRREVGMVFQDYALFPDRSVLDNVMFGLRARKVPAAAARKKAIEMLERVGLQEFASQKPQSLSGGQRQRVAMARALVIEPKLLLLDEPLSALDAGLRSELRHLVRQLQREFGITTVFVTHDQEEALAISDQVAVMQAGSIIQMAKPQEVYREPTSAFVARFVGNANLLKIRSVLPAGSHGLHRLLTDVGIVLSSRQAPESGGSFVSVRGESISLLEGEPEAEGELAGVIQSVEFRGATVGYDVNVSDQRLRVNRPTTAVEPVYLTGQKVVLHLPTDAPIVTA